MAFVASQNVIKDNSLGQAINKAVKLYVNPELKKRKIKDFQVAGILIEPKKPVKVYLDSEVEVLIEFKKRKLDPEDTGKNINIRVDEIENINWNISNISENTAIIFICKFNENWWVWDANFKGQSDLEKNFQVVTTHVIRGRGHLPLKLKKQTKPDFYSEQEIELKKKLPSVWRRHLTISQRYTGVMSYDGNYFDLFTRAQKLYEIGDYYSSIVICRIASEQAVIRILVKSGKIFDAYRDTKQGKSEDLKGIKELVDTCFDQKIFKNKKYPINRISKKKLIEIAHTANDLVHSKVNLQNMDSYKETALKCMDNLHYVIKNHLNFIKDTKVVSGYRHKGKSNRLN